ncbi:hypothetical protein LOZ66_002621 [Ophidiomyces ophidiicola]|nr:hypothetical protein LOZ65_001503 [Ophidiomyces ophidiicola]KAI1940186.1 hypothetical protein LOZ66_002621 [Ophidiomyces ophidiicola]
MAQSDYSPDCPFCAVASANPPYTPSSPVNGLYGVNESQSEAHIILSTRHVLAFLDIMPLTQGHVLVIPRKHFKNLGAVNVKVGKELGKWLPIISRVVVKTILGTEPDERGEDPAHWNVVQNNGLRAAQTVPHAHFHIIPRPPLERSPQPGASWVMFGRGQRDELDDDDGRRLAGQLRGAIAQEIIRVKQAEGIDLDTDSIEDGPESLRLLKL